MFRNQAALSFNQILITQQQPIARCPQSQRAVAKSSFKPITKWMCVVVVSLLLLLSIKPPTARHVQVTEITDSLLEVQQLSRTLCLGVRSIFSIRSSYTHKANTQKNSKNENENEINE